MDLTRGKHYFIPKLLYACIKKYNRKKSLKELKQIYYSKYPAVFDEYYQFLKQHEFVEEIPGELIDHFTPLEFTFEYPFLLENIVIAITSQNIDAIVELVNKETINLTKNYGLLIHPKVSKTKLSVLIKEIN